MSMPADTLFTVGANLDLRFRGTGTPSPSDVILDHMYGIAAFKCWRWGLEASREMLQTYYESRYKPVLLTPNPHSATDDDGGSDCDDGGDPRDANYIPDASQQQ
jgi:hypothetical protein